MKKNIRVLLILFVFGIFSFFCIAKENENLIIPTQEQLKACGYPTNAYGETYGPDICYKLESSNSPDLILVQNDEGTLGYVKRKELDDEVVSINDALEKNTNIKKKLSMYLQDGKTYVGDFIIGE